MPHNMISVLFAALSMVQVDAAYPRPAELRIAVVFNNIPHRPGLTTGNPIHLLMGGFHLTGTDRAEIQAIIARLRALGVEKVAPSHCTGDAAIALFRQAWGKDFVEGGLGAVIEVPLR